MKPKIIIKILKKGHHVKMIVQRFNYNSFDAEGICFQIKKNSDEMEVGRIWCKQIEGRYVGEWPFDDDKDFLDYRQKLIETLKQLSKKRIKK